MNPSYQIYDRGLSQKISFHKMNYQQDLPTVYKWMHQEHVIPYWQLNLPFEQYSNHLKKALADFHQTLYIGKVDNCPMSYWESYWVKGDVVENSYKAEAFDQGVHLLIGDKNYLGKGYALPLLRAMVQFQFTQPETTKVIAEPDIRNHKMIHIFKKCGFKAVKPIELPDKTGLLMFCERKVFERRWQHVCFAEKAGRSL